MARAGIYKSEIIRARNNLLAMGRYPSIDAIRGELGNTGSKTTIHRYLKEIDEEEGDHTGKRVAVSDSILDLSSRLAERLHEEADQHVIALNDKHKAEIVQLNEQISALRDEVALFRGQAEKLALELADEKAAHGQTQAVLQEEKISQTKLIQRVKGLETQQSKDEEHRKSLEEKHRHARDTLEHFRMAAKEQREQEQRQFEQQIQFLQGELRTARDTINAKQQALVASNVDNAKLSNELAHLQTEYQRANQECKLLRNAKEQLTIAEAKIQQLSLQIKEGKDHEAELVRKINLNAEKLEEAKATGQRLEIELMAAKTTIETHEQFLQKLPLLNSLLEKTIDIPN